MLPRRAVPNFSVPLLAGGTLEVAKLSPPRFSLIVAYRGFHCPLCKIYLTELSGLLDEFGKRGVDVVALSSDDRGRAEKMQHAIGSDSLKIGYGLKLSDARSWGLYISSGRGTTSIGVEEPALFAEPGVFIVRADGTLYYGNTQTMPFARPHFKELLLAIDYAIDKNYPARGEYDGPV